MIALLLLAAAAASEAPICADRPTKANGTCTVPAGHVQAETGLIDWVHDRSAGVRTDVTLWGGTFVKYGIGENSDLELGLTPFETVRVRGADHQTSSGVGDTVVRWKQRLTAADASVQAALIPFAKLPTASHNLGNGKAEGGVAVPLNTPVAKAVTLTIGPELDLRADADGHGYHAAMVQLVNLGWQATSKLALGAELWSQWDWAPDGTTRQVSADAAAAYLVSDRLQLDAGANFGLNRRTPDLEIYAGIATRF